MARARSTWLSGSLFLFNPFRFNCMRSIFPHVSSSLLFTTQWVESIASLCFIYYWLAALFCGFCSGLFWGELFFDFCCYHRRRGFHLGHHPEGSVYTIRGHNCHLSNGQRVTTFWNHSSCFVSLTRVMQRKRSEEKAETPARTKGCHHIVLLIFLAASHFGRLQNTLFPSLILPLCFLKFFTNRMYLLEG